MIKLYPRLHTSANHFTKQFLSISLMLFGMLCTGIHTNAQCPVVNVSPVTSCGGIPGIGAFPCNPLTASGNADTYVWSPLTGLYLDCQTNIPYTGTNTTIVYAAPTSYTVYTVTGTITSSGCSSTATARVNYTPPPPIVTPNPAVMCLGDPAVKLKVISPQNVLQFCSGPVNIAVPDNNPAGASNSITLSGIGASCNLIEMSVSINMPHTRIGNMVFVLKAPNGMIINLDYHLTTSGGNGPTAGFVNSVISSTGTVALSAGTNPYTGTFRADAQGTPAGGFGATGPTGMLATTATWASLVPTAASANGTWTLGFYDGVTGDVGTLASWCLRISYSCGPAIPATPAIWSPAAGLFLDAACTMPYIPGTGIDSVWARPAPAGIYTYAVTTQSVPGPLVSFTNPNAISIPVGGTAAAYPSDLIVSGIPTGMPVKSVVLNGVSHSRSNDIDVLLQSPSGQNIILMSDVGGTNAINATYTFVNAGGGGSMNATLANPTGSYLPTNNQVPDNFPAPGPGNVIQAVNSLSMFTGNMNGTWKLFVFDDDGTGDQGMISGGYTINFDTVAPCFSIPTYVPVTVWQPISITSQPVNQTICSDKIASFTVAAGGSGPFTYQWQENANGPWNNITNAGVYSGVTTPTLTITAPPVSMNGYNYRVIVNGSAPCAATTSTPALLTVDPLPDIVITANPLIIGPTQTTTIFSTVTPNPALSYTWYYNNAVLPGAVSSSFLVNYGSPGDYQLQVTDVNGCSNLSNIITIGNSFALNMFTYPNPSGGVFEVRYHSEPNSTLQRSLIIYNNRGENIITRTFTQTVPYQKIDVDLRAHGKGLYWIELRDAEGKRLAMNRAVVQ